MKIKNYFEKYLEYLRQKGLRDHTVREHKRFLDGAISHAGPVPEKEISELKLIDVANVIERGREHGEYGSQRAVVTFRQFLKFLKNSGIEIPFDYRDIEVPKVPQKAQPVCYPKELRKIPTNNICSLRTRALLEVLFASGMRISEALSLKRSDIDWKKKEAIVKGKGGNEETVYFTERSLRWLKKYLTARKDNCPYLFVNILGKGQLSRATARNYLARHRKEWGFEKPINHHSFRRGLATYLIEQGADIKTTQYILRHKSERTTLRYYVMINKRRAKKIHQKILNKI